MLALQTNIKEAKIKSVLNSKLSFDNEPDKLQVEENDLEQIDLECFKKLYDLNNVKQTSIDQPIFVPIKLNEAENSLILNGQCSAKKFFVPQQLLIIDNELNNNPQSSIIKSLLRMNDSVAGCYLSSRNQNDEELFTSTATNNSFCNAVSFDKLFDNRKSGMQTMTIANEQFHCTCCAHKKYCVNVNKKWCSLPVLNLVDSGDSCYESINNTPPTEINNVCDDDEIIMSEYNFCDDYTEVDMNSIRQAQKENVTVSVNNLCSNINHLQNQNKQLHCDIKEIKEDFKVDNLRVSKLIKDAQNLVADLKDLKYLDDLIFMLEGQLEQIEMKPWPFRVLKCNKNVPARNLIV